MAFTDTIAISRLRRISRAFRSAPAPRAVIHAFRREFRRRLKRYANRLPKSTATGFRRSLSREMVVRAYAVASKDAIVREFPLERLVAITRRSARPAAEP